MASDPDSPWIDPPMHHYCVARTTPPDDVQRDLIAQTATLGPRAIMQIGPDQGALIELLVRAMGAQRAVEVGTFTGYSALCIARGLADDGQLICCDISETWTSIGHGAWERAGVDHKIDLRIGPAIDTLRALPDGEWIDVAFIDADKTGYAGYYEELLPRVRRGGVILVDNTLWSGKVLAEPEPDDEDTAAILSFNDQVADDDRVLCVLLPIADGLTLLQKR